MVAKRLYWALLGLLSLCLPLTPSIANEVSSKAANSLSVVWSTDVDGRKPGDTMSFSSPVVVGSGEQARIVLGGRDARVHIYDMQGKERYRLPIQQNSDSGAAVLTSGLVVLGDSQGKLYGVDAQHGQLLWTFTLSSSLTGTPLPVDDDVIVQTTDNNIYRINAKGKKVWSFASQQGGLGLYVTSSPMLHDGKLYALLSNGDAIGMDAQTGDLMWRKQLLLDTDAAVLSKLKAPQATPVWLPKVSFDGRLLQDVVLFSFYQGKIFLLNRDNGQTLWSQDLSLKSSPVVFNQVLYSVDTQGVLRAMQQYTAQQLWQRDLESQEWLGPVIWQHSLWLVSVNGDIVQLSLKGNVLAQLDIGGHVERLPVATENGLLVRNTLGGLYLIHE